MYIHVTHINRYIPEFEIHGISFILAHPSLLTSLPQMCNVHEKSSFTFKQKVTLTGPAALSN